MLPHLYIMVMLSVVLARTRAWKLAPPSAVTLRGLSRVNGGAPQSSFRMLSDMVRDSMGDGMQSKEETLDPAHKWTSYKLSNTDAKELDKALGIDDKVRSAIKLGNQSRRREEKKDTFGKIKGVDLGEQQTMIRGFLQVNPAICSGCGTPFQSKSPERPGQQCSVKRMGRCCFPSRKGYSYLFLITVNVCPLWCRLLAKGDVLGAPCTGGPNASNSRGREGPEDGRYAFG
jgi:hypothetical protein